MTNWPSFTPPPTTGPLVPFFVASDRKAFQEVAAKNHSSLTPQSWQAPDAPSKRTTKKCTIKTSSFDLFSGVLESHSSSDLVWVVGAAAACWGGSARDRWKEVKRARFDGAFFCGTFWWCIRGLPTKGSPPDLTTKTDVSKVDAVGFRNWAPRSQSFDWQCAIHWETDFISAGTGKNWALSIRFPDPSPVLDKNRTLMGPEILSSAGAGVWRKVPKAFPDSSSVLDKVQSAIHGFRPPCIWPQNLVAH